MQFFWGLYCCAHEVTLVIMDMLIIVFTYLLTWWPKYISITTSLTELCSLLYEYLWLLEHVYEQVAV